MLTNDLTVTATGSSTKPGSAAAKVFNLVSTEANKSTRRVASTSTSTPEVCVIRHETVGTGFKQKLRSQIEFSFTRQDTDLADTAGVVPFARAYLVIERPVQSAGAITTTHVKDLISQVIDTICVSGQCDKLLNLEP